jgi:hypothetical protein
MAAGLVRLGWQPGLGSQPPRDTEVFKLMDIKGDGVVDAQELKIGLTRLRKGWVEEVEIKQVMQAYDANGDGVLQQHEFSAFVRGLDYEARTAAQAVDPLEAQLLQLADEPPPTAPRAGDKSPSSVTEPQGRPRALLSATVPGRPVLNRSGGPGPSPRGSPGLRALTPPRAAQPSASRISHERLSAESSEDRTDVAFGVKREAWDAAAKQFVLQEKRGSGSSGYGRGGNSSGSVSSSFAAADLAAVLRATGCGLRTDERFLRLLGLKLDPAHRGVVKFTELKKWLKTTMALVGAVEASGAPSRERPERSAQLQMAAVAAAVSAPVPSLDHPALDSAVLALARLRMHAPPRTPLHADLTAVLSLRGYLPAQGPALVGADVTRVLQRYDDKGGGFVAAESLHQVRSQSSSRK